MAGIRSMVQPYEFDPESDPEGEAPEEVQTLRLQQDVSEWLVTNFVYLDILILFCSCVYCCTVTNMQLSS